MREASPKRVEDQREDQHAERRVARAAPCQAIQETKPITRMTA